VLGVLRENPIPEWRLTMARNELRDILGIVVHRGCRLVDD